MAPLNSPNDKHSESRRLQTLTNAARISRHIKGPTIGPNSVDPTTIDEQAAQPTAPSGQTSSDSSTEPTTSSSSTESASTKTSRWRYDAWRPVATDNDDDDADQVDDSSADNRFPWRRHTSTNVTLSDCRDLRFRMILKTAQKQQRQSTAAKCQSQYDELVAKLDRFRIDSTAKALDNIRQATLAKEERILEAARQLDEEARLAAEQRGRECAERQRCSQERASRLRRDEELRGHFEAFKSAKNLFIVVFERLVKTILQNQQTLAVGFVEYSEQQQRFLQRYERLFADVNRGQISAVEVAGLEGLCDEMQALQQRVDAEIEADGERLAKLAEEEQRQRKEQREQRERQEAEEKAAREQQEKEKQHNEQLQLEQKQQQQQQQQEQTTAVVASDSAAAESGQFVHSERLAVYTQTLEFYENYKLSVKPLQADDNLKKYRFNCQKAVNIPLNAISAVSAQHLADKFDKLCTLLSGGRVQVGDMVVSAGEHPLGVRFCSLLAAKKLVNQADSIISTNPMHAFPIAAIIVAVWQRFPDMGQLCMAYLYKESPYLAPYFVPRRAGQSGEEFLLALGYRIGEGGQVESSESYLKRQSGLVRLYAAIVVTRTRRDGGRMENPHGLRNGWIWLANFMNLDPLPEICATLLHEFLVVAGSDLWLAYGRQFQKLLLTLYQHYLTKLSLVDEGGPRARLEGLVVRMLQEGRISEPEGKLPANFW